MNSTRQFAACAFLSIVTGLSTTASGQEERTADEVDIRIAEQADLTLSELLRAGGRTMHVLLLMSMATVAAAIYCAATGRRSAVAPNACHTEAMGLLRAGKVKDAGELLTKTPSIYSRSVRAGIAAQPEHMYAAAEATATREAGLLRGRQQMLPALAVVSALIGVLGTIGGFIHSFGAAASERFHYPLVYSGVMRALIVSFAGVSVALLALVLYYLLRSRLERSLIDLDFRIREVLGGINDITRDAK